MTEDILALVPERIKGIPRWALEAYDGDEMDLTAYLVGSSFWEKNSQLVEDLMDNPKALEIAVAEAKFNALGRTLSLDSTVDRAKIHQLLLARRQGWPMLLPGNYADTKSLLAGLIVEFDETSSENKDLAYVIDTLLPSLEKIGVPPEKIVSIPSKLSKTRAIVPAMRQALKELDGEDLTDRIDYLLGLVADDSVGVRDIREMVRQKGVTAEIDEADVYLDGEDYLVVIRISHPKRKSLLRAVKSALNNIVLSWNDDRQIPELIKSIMHR